MNKKNKPLHPLFFRGEMQRKEKSMKAFKVSFGRLMVFGFGMLGLIVALANCGNSSSSGGRVSSFLNGLPAAHLIIQPCCKSADFKLSRYS
jgi:hypothetical protein